MFRRFDMRSGAEAGRRHRAQSRRTGIPGLAGLAGLALAGAVQTLAAQGLATPSGVARPDLSASMPATAWPSSTSPAGPGGTSSSSKFLVPIVMAAMTPALQAGLGCVFDRLFSFMGSNPSPACNQPNQTAVLKPADAPPAAATTAPSDVATASPTQAPNPAPPADANPGGAAAQAQLLAASPVLTFIVNKLSDATPQAKVTQAVQFADVQRPGGGPLAFDIRTGEVFAILFSTSVPGRVRLINTDAKQNVSASDVYEAMPAADNRMPRDWQGGITMTGDKGTEYLDVEFTPCLSPRYAADPRIAMFQGLLPACSSEAATKRFTPARPRGGGGPGEGGAKAMVFPGSPSPGQPIALAPGNYAKGDGLTFRITINHL